MKIILTETVEKLGQAGEVKEVANGYARNFLFPRNLAIPATRGALLEVTNRRTTAEKRASTQLSAAQIAADKLRGLTVLLYGRTGEQNRLYGSITAADIAEALRVQHGQTVDRRRIKLDTAIHRTGNYTATITLGNNLSAQVNLSVEPETNRGRGLTSVATAAPAPPPAPAAPAVLPPATAAAEAPAAVPETAVPETAPAAEALVPAEMPVITARPAEAPVAEMPVAVGSPAEAATAELPEAAAATAPADLPGAETAAVLTPVSEVHTPTGESTTFTPAGIQEAPLPGAPEAPAPGEETPHTV